MKYESLAGTWRNGKGDTLVIRVDGSVTSTVSGNTGEESLQGAFRYEMMAIPYSRNGEWFHWWFIGVI